VRGRGGEGIDTVGNFNFILPKFSMKIGQISEIGKKVLAKTKS
jgi:hypothetical protein